MRARIVPPEQVRHYRWTSLPSIVKGTGWTDDEGWRAGRRFTSDAGGRQAYERYLIEAGLDEAGWESRGLTGLSRGWAISTAGWRRAVAKDFSHLKLDSSMEQAEGRDLRESRWEAALLDTLREMRRHESDLATKPMKQAWKILLAAQVRRRSGAALTWLAKRLQLGAASTLRSYICRVQTMQQRTRPEPVCGHRLRPAPWAISTRREHGRTTLNTANP